jgi:predicted O-methyltransferase YrrM
MAKTRAALWTAVDQYLTETLVRPDAALEAAIAAAEKAGLPAISVSPPQGKLLHLLVTLAGAKSVLEIGTLAAYSTIWMARALAPGGRLLTLEAEATHAEVARRNLERAGVADRVALKLGRALDTLPTLSAADGAPFDVIFIDADKPPLADYFVEALRLSRPGTLIVIDNVIRDGAVADSSSRDASVQGVRRLNDRIAATPNVDATSIQTVGAKGYDGFTLVRVTEST